jgi:hypothetical protein
MINYPSHAVRKRRRIHFALYRRSVSGQLCVKRLRIHRTRRTTRVVGTGSAVSPSYFCLSAQGNWLDRSDDRATLDGLKLFRLSSGLV